MCNVGATTTTNYNSTAMDRTTLASVDGKLFQFARNDGFNPYGATPTLSAGSPVATNIFTGAVATTWYYNATNIDWRNTMLSTAFDFSLNIWTTSPCAVGYRPPI